MKKFFLFSCFFAAAQGAFAQGTSFTYQGRLTDGPGPATGIYDLRFSMFDTPTGGVQQGATVTNATTGVTNGLFTVTLDFGNQFPGNARWLEIGVRTNGGSIFTTLSPRQPLTATPYSVTAGNVTGPVAAANLSGTVPIAQLPSTLVTNGASGVTFNGSFTGAVSATTFTGTITSNNIADYSVTANKLALIQDYYRAFTLHNPLPGVDEPFGGFGFGEIMAPLGSDRFVVGGYDAAYLYSSNGTLLFSFANPNPPTNGYDNYFGYPVVPMGGDKVWIDAEFDGTNSAGLIYLFNTNGTVLNILTNPLSVSTDFGRTIIPIGNDRLFVSADFYGVGTNFAIGIAYLFNTNGTLLTTFTNPAPSRADFFGNAALALGADRLLISAPEEDFVTTNTGVVYVFNTNGVLLSTFTNPAPTAFTGFGESMALLGTDRLIIGSSSNVYILNTNGTLLTTITNVTNNRLVPSLAVLDNNRLLVGLPGYGVGNMTNSGILYLYDTNGTRLFTIPNPAPATNDEFSFGLTVVGDKVLVGANGPATTNAVYTTNGYDGIAYQFAFDYYVPGLLADTLRPGAVNTAALADGAVTADKISGVLFASQIPNIDAGLLTSGLLADGRLSTNVALLNRNQNFTGANTFYNPLNFFYGTYSGFGNGLTHLQSSQLEGSIPTALLPSGFLTNTATGVTLTGTFAGNGNSLTNLNPTNLLGIVPDAKLSGNVALRSGGNSFSGNQIFTNGNIGIGTTNPLAPLDVNGAIAAGSLRAPGAGTNTDTFAFIHVAVSTNTSAHITTIYNPLIDNDPGAILIVTHNWTADTNAVTKYETNLFGVFYSNPHWAIFHEDHTTPILGRAFNVLVIKP